jgi:DNA-binding winged helix-turn-helix (wHTH) protein
VRFAFGGFELDTDAVELRHLGAPVPLEPRVFDVLEYLVRHRERVVPKEELLDEVWGDRFVTESALSSCVRHIRRVLDDDGTAQRFVRTARGRGYRFVAPVTAAAAPPAVAGQAGQAVPHSLPPDRTPLFGRDEEIDAIADAVSGHRLVTLLGMGGVGKTRLAVAAGEDLTQWTRDVAPPIANLVNGQLPEIEEQIWRDVTEAWAPFTTPDGRVRTQNQARWVAATQVVPTNRVHRGGWLQRALTGDWWHGDGRDLPAAPPG